ncbi:DUF2752 domain-containing protein [Leptothermofonsia sichuanensis E412]|nr:DUF2752 domain-containing protein [Leptothermofonsia sichuanensis E412]
MSGTLSATGCDCPNCGLHRSNHSIPG